MEINNSLIDLKKSLLDEYQESNKKYLSDKQKQFILTLYSQISNDEDKQLFKKQIEEVDTYSKTQVYLLINELKKYVPAATPMIILIMNKFTEDDINKLLKKDTKKDTNYKDDNKKDLSIISQYDAELILKGPEKFVPWIKEHPILSEEEWEFGYQESTLFKDEKMYYLKFYNMMMLDYDNFTLDELLEHLKQYDKFRFRIYESHGGFHVFIISRIIPYNHILSEQLAKEMLSDIYYNMFSYKTGYKVRLSKKLGRNEKFVSKFICEIGMEKELELGNGKIHPLCRELIKIHDLFLNL